MDGEVGVVEVVGRSSPPADGQRYPTEIMLWILRLSRRHSDQIYHERCIIKHILLLLTIISLINEHAIAQSARDIVELEEPNVARLEWTYTLDEYSRLQDKYLASRSPRDLEDLMTYYLSDSILRVGEKSVVGSNDIKRDLEGYLAGLLVRQKTGVTYRESRSVVQVVLASETEVICVVETTGYHYQMTEFFAKSTRYDVVAIKRRDDKWGIAMESLGAVDPDLLTSKTGGVKALTDAQLVSMYKHATVR